MKATLLLLSLLFLAGSRAAADDDLIKELRLSGMMTNRVYRNVRVVREEPDGLRISHDSGFAKVPYEALPDDMRRKFDPTGANRFRADAAERERLSQTADSVVQRQDMSSIPRTAIEGPRLVTTQDVKERWLRQQPPLDYALRKDVNAGVYDKLASRIAHAFNARVLNKWGAMVEAMEEQKIVGALAQEIASTPLLAEAFSTTLTDPYINTEPDGPPDGTGQFQSSPPQSVVASSSQPRGNVTSQTSVYYTYSAPWTRTQPYSSGAISNITAPTYSLGYQLRTSPVTTTVITRRIITPTSSTTYTISPSGSRSFTDTRQSVYGPYRSGTGWVGESTTNY